jgi:hypothetical protein
VARRAAIGQIVIGRHSVAGRPAEVEMCPFPARGIDEVDKRRAKANDLTGSPGLRDAIPGG